MAKRLKQITILIIGFVIPQIVTASPIDIDRHLNGEKIGLFLEFLEDKKGRLTLNDIASETRNIDLKWQKSDKSVLGFGFSNSVYWIRFTVKNNTDRTINWHLNQVYCIIDYLTLYAPRKNGGYTEIKTGDYFVFNERPVKYKSFLFPLKTGPGEIHTYFLRYKSSSAINISLETWSPNAIEDYISKEMPVYWSFYGAYAIMCIFNLFVFWYTQELAYSFYVLFIAFCLLTMMSLDGIAFQYLWPASVWWANFCIPIFSTLTIIFLIQFARYMIDVKKLTPRIDLIHRLVIILLIINIFITLVFKSYRFGMINISAIVAFIAAFGLWASAYRALSKKHKSREAAFFFVTFSLLLIGALFFVLKTLSILPSNLLTTYSMKFGASFGIVVLSLFLPDRLNILKNKLTTLNENLEETVKKRTTQLQVAQAELVQAAHKAGMADMARDMVHNIGNIANSVNITIEGLNKMKELRSTHALKQANGLLRKNMTNLGHFIRVDKRGKKLMKYYLEIEKFINLEQETINTYVDRVFTKVNEIEGVIEAQLEYADEAYLSETLQVVDIIEDVLAMQKEIFEKNGIIVERKFEKVPKISIQKTKFSFIIANIISNAVQAMSIGGTPEKRLTLSVYSGNGKVYISTKDTGIGIVKEDMKKVFRLNLNQDQDKKGVSLYSCENYMAEMGGKMWVESKGKQKGAAFFLEFPISDHPSTNS